jgi:hypothetical protein
MPLVALRDLEGDNRDAVLAAIGLGHRSGARRMEVGYMRAADEPLYAACGPGWYMQARYRGGILIATCTDHSTPAGAADELGLRLLAGGTCLVCHKPITLEVLPVAMNLLCHWRRVGRQWRAACCTDPTT